MKTIQFDECVNSKELEAACRAEGKCIPHRFPKRFKGRGLGDPQVLELFFAQGKIVLTNDENILSDHLQDIPESHPGLVIVTHSDNCRDELTDTANRAILSNFKAMILRWDEVVCRNSIIVITESSIEVLHKEAGKLNRDFYIVLPSNDAQNLYACLQDNCIRD